MLMQTKLLISVKTEPTNVETPQLLNKLRTLISNNINTNIQTTTEFELINKMATLREKDLKNNKYKDLFRDITIKIKKGEFKNLEKIFTKKFIKKNKSVEFCNSYNSARKLFLIYILNLNKAENSREVLLYTNIINNLCLNNSNEFLQNIALMFSNELNLNRGLLRTFIISNIGNDGISPLIEYMDYTHFNIRTLEDIYIKPEELKSVKGIEDIAFYKELLNNQTLESKKLLESGASFNFLKNTQPLLPCYYLYTLQLEDTYFNDINIRLSIKKTGEFLINKSENKEHPLIKLLIKYICLWLREGSDSIKYECLVVLFNLLEKNYIFLPADSSKDQVKEILTYKYKGKGKTAKLRITGNQTPLKKDMVNALMDLDEILFYELLVKTNKNVINSLIDEVDLKTKMKKLVPIFNIHLLKIDGLIKGDCEMLIEIYKYTLTDKDKVKVLREILNIAPNALHPGEDYNVNMSDMSILRFNKKDSKELCQMKISKIKRLQKLSDPGLIFEYLNISNDLFYEACEVASVYVEMFPLIKSSLLEEIDPPSQVHKGLAENLLENIKRYPDAVSMSIVKLIKQFMKTEEVNENKEDFVKVFNCLLEYSKGCSYEKYTNVYLCRGELETIINSSEPLSITVPFIKETNNKANKENKESHILNMPTTSPSVLQMTSFSEILYIESTHEIQNTNELHVIFTVINQSLIPISEIQIIPLTKLKVKKFIPEFLIKQRSIDKKTIILEMETNYSAPLDLNMSNASLDNEMPIVLNFVVSFKYSKNNVRKQEVLNLKPIEIPIESLFKKPNIEYSEFISKWKSLEWERLQVIKQLNDFNESTVIKKLQGNFQVIKVLKYEETEILNLVTFLNKKFVFVNILLNEANLRIRVRSESRNLVDTVSEYLRVSICL